MSSWSLRSGAVRLVALALALSAAPTLARDGGGEARGSDDRAGAFTIAVIPDTQNYVDVTKPQPLGLEIFKAETRYLAEHRRDLKLAFVTHVGDVVQHGDGTNGNPGDATYGAGLEWDRAAEALDLLSQAGVPFAVTPGNHDYDNYSYTAANGNAPLRSTVMWRRYFGPASRFFSHRRWYGGASDSLAFDPGLSSYQVFSAGGRDFLHIALQMEASDAAIAWAQAVIDAHPGFATIVTTHAYLDPPADTDAALPLEVPGTRIPAAARYLKGSPGGWNDAQGVWEKLIRKNDQIFMVLSGHAWGATVAQVSKSQNLRVDLNAAGHTVYQLLTDYQGNTSAGVGGDGWLRLMRFDLAGGTIHFQTYSPVLDQVAGEDGAAAFNQSPLFSAFSLPMPVQVTQASRGQVDRR